MCRDDPTDLNSLFTNTTDMHQYIEDLGLADERILLGGMTFDEQAPAGYQAAEKIEIRYSSETFGLWTYDGDTGMYHRSQETGDGQSNVSPLIDMLSGEHVDAANVIVVFVPHEINPDPTGPLEIRLIGRGPALLFRDQRAYLITWERLDANQGLSYKFDDGMSFPLKPGKSWIELVGSSSLIERPAENTWSVRYRTP
jgi:hypothetical protein